MWREFGTFTLRKSKCFNQAHAVNTLAGAEVMVDINSIWHFYYINIPYTLLPKLPYTILTII